MSEHKPLSKETAGALLDFAGIDVPPERVVQLAADSDVLFSEANEVSAFMAPRREIGMSVQFSPLVGRKRLR